MLLSNMYESRVNVATTHESIHSHTLHSTCLLQPTCQTLLSTASYKCNAIGFLSVYRWKFRVLCGSLLMEFRQTLLNGTRLHLVLFVWFVVLIHGRLLSAHVSPSSMKGTWWDGVVVSILERVWGDVVRG